MLLLAPINGKSHFLYISSFAKALLERGHEVTFLTSNSLSHLKLANYTEVLIDPPLDLLGMSKYSNDPNKIFIKSCYNRLLSLVKQDDLIERSSGSIFGGITFMPTFVKMMNEYNLENSHVQKFIKRTDLHFDVIVAEEFYADSFLMLGYKHQAPIVTICV